VLNQTSTSELRRAAKAGPVGCAPEATGIFAGGSPANDLSGKNGTKAPSKLVTTRMAGRSISVCAKPARTAERARDALLEQIRQCDEDAARTLFNELHPLVLKLVRAYLPRRTSEEDLVQTVFMKIFANLDQYSGKVPLEHWVSRIAVNTCLNQLKAEKVRPELRWADLSEEEQYVMESLASTREEFDPTQHLTSREVVAKLLGCLPHADRLVIRLLHLEGRSLRDVQQVTGWGIAMIKVRAFRARQKLKKCFERLNMERPM
jgi:RNA polymerase sigma factor (sigma-70 family)